MKKPCIIGVDIGTSSSKGVLVGEDGAVLATAIRQHEVSRPESGHVEMDPQIWWDEFQSLTSELLSRDYIELQAIGVSGMGPCVAITDTQDKPLMPAILYGVDTRAGIEINEINEYFSAEQIYADCDSYLSSQAAGPKIKWALKQLSETDAPHEKLRFYMPASWIVKKLTGRYCLDRQSASQCTPLYNPASGQWYPKYISSICPDMQMPELFWSGEVVGYTRGTDSIDAGIPVIAGTIDAWAEGYSVGALENRHLFLMYGSTMFMIATTEERIKHPAMWGTTCLVQNRYNLAGGMATSGAITSWAKKLFGDLDYGDLIQQAEKSPAGAKGLLVLPYFAGERTPIQDSQARGVIAGLTLEHGQAEIYRAILEATGFAIKHNLESFAVSGAKMDAIVAAGGGVSSRFWPQIVSDIVGYDQIIRKYTIGAAFGDAMLAAKAAGIEVNLDSWNPVLREIVSKPKSIYTELYELYRELYPATIKIQHSLAEIGSHFLSKNL